MSKLSIRSLPDELVIEILRLVDSIAPLNSRLHSLRSLSLCSKHLHLLTEPFLYSTYYTQTQYDYFALYLFVRTILARHSLAQLVKRFSGFLSGFPVVDGDLMTHDDHTRLERAIVRVLCNPLDSDVNIDKWLQGRAKTCDTLNALLLSLLTNLECIELTVCHPRPGYPRIESILKRARNLQENGLQASEFAMAKVREVRLEGMKENFVSKSDIPLDMMSPFLSLPSVEVFSGCGVSDSYLGSAMPDWPELLGTGASTITSMTFEEANLGDDALLGFFALFPNLKRFSYDFDDVLNQNNEFLPLNEVLGRYIHCLEELSLTQLDKSNSEVYEGAMVGPLSQFKNLKMIRASAHILIGFPEVTLEATGFHSHEADDEDLCYPQQLVTSFVNSMPICLENLTLNQCNEAIFAIISSWLAAGLPSKLRQISIVFDKDAVERRNIEAREDFLWTRLWLDRLASEQGVEIDWIF